MEALDGVKRQIRRSLKKLVGESGLPRSHALDVANGLLRYGAWLRERGVPATFPDRFGLYRHLREAVCGDAPVDYLEFGVYRGESLREWTRLVSHPDARFWGFDTFTGLPEDWQHVGGHIPQGHFDTGGRLPAIGDGRVGFVRGVFQDTLDDFLGKNAPFDPKRRLIVHCDADLYSSTLYVLTKLDPLLRPGTIVLFDEFSSVLNEFRALLDYAAAYRRDYRLLATAGPYHTQAAIELG